METIERPQMSWPCGKELKELEAGAAWPAVSIYMPIARSADATHHNTVLLGDLSRQAATSLLEQGVEVPACVALLKRLEALASSPGFWQQRGNGLCVFISDTIARCYHLPVTFAQQVVVGSHFYIVPLLPLLPTAGEYLILALSLLQVRLVRVQEQTCSNIELPAAVPRSLADTLRYSEFEQQKDLYTGTPGWGDGRPGAVYFGQGVGSDEKKPEILRFCRQIDHGLRELLAKRRAPLVLAGVEYLQSIYRHANNYPYLLADGISGNADHRRDEELRAAAWPLVRPVFAEAELLADQRYRDMAGTGLTSDDLAEVLRHASAGRIETLFVATSAHCWGRFDPASGALHLDEQRQPGVEELLNLAACQTIACGGTIYAVDPDRMPSGTNCAALLRY